MRRSSYSGLRTIRGFLHANPVSFLYELTSICLPTDLSTTFTFSRIFIRVDDRSPAMCVFYGHQFPLPYRTLVPPGRERRAYCGYLNQGHGLSPLPRGRQRRPIIHSITHAPDQTTGRPRL